MNSKKQLGILVIGLIAVFLLLVMFFSFLMEDSAKTIQEVSKLTKEELAIAGGDQTGSLRAQGAHDSNAFYKNGSFYYEALPTSLNKVFIPTLDDIQLYCIQRGTAFSYNKTLVDTIRALDGVTGSVSSGSHLTSLPEDRYSNTYYVCVNNHTEMIPSGAYIVTTPNNIIAPTDGYYESYGQRSEFKKGENISKEVRQVAMWLNPEMNVGESFESTGTEFTYLDMAEALKQEAFDYRDYEEELKNHVDEPIKETTDQKIKININSKEQYIILGPYKMEYVEGNSASAKFAGISNMVVKGYNDKEQQEFIKDIEIISYYQNGVEHELKFFTPLEEDGYVDRNEQSYPVSGQEFYIKIKNPNQNTTDSDERVRYIDITVEYSYMSVSAIQCQLDGRQLIAKPVRTGHHDSYNDDGDLTSCRVNYRWEVIENPLAQQYMIDAWGERNLYKLEIHLNGDGDDDGGPEDITMNLGGYVWEDVKGNKQNVSDGIYSSLYNAEEIDRILPNVKVTLYECPVDENGNLQYQNGELVSHVADLMANADLENLSDSELQYYMNPTITDEYGYYQFNGLNAANKYYVTFEYNGQIYLPTEYLVIDMEEDGSFVHADSVSDMVFNVKLYNTDIWNATSKGTEDQDLRDDYNTQFGEIGSSPKNYVSSNSLESGELLREGSTYYNETFSTNDLMGFGLNEDGDYEEQDVQLIDGFYEVQDGYVVETDTIREGEISRRIQNYMERYHEYPDEEALYDIYQEIVDDYARSSVERETLWKKLQFIEDCKMQAYTGSPFENGEIDLYPVYDDFTIDNENMVIPGEGTKPPIYDGQYYVNLGLWRREQNNLALRKDIYRAATRINGKTEVYEYDKRSDDDKYWEIQLRMQDYNNYYGTNYNRELYPADYYYRAEETNLYGSELELYVTYKITIRNSSQGLLNEITEVVDYYDKDYTYMPDLSWVMYKNDNTENNQKVSISRDEYYNMIDNLDLGEIAYARDIDSSYSTRANSDGTYCGDSIYGDNSKQDLEQEFNSVYINGLDGKQLATGENAYIYLTFKVNSDSQGPVILDDDDSLKQNYVEINGYRSYYSDGTTMPNEVVIEGNDTVAGIIDMNSTPGNLSLDDLEGNKYEKNFEDDTDRAKGIKVLLEEEAIRNIIGNVWEDERTESISDSIIGDGVRQEDEIGIQGITVELVEKLDNGSEYVWQSVQTDENGNYRFSDIIPGNYIVRFRYGHNNETVLTAPDGGENAVSYNGQDFKSTLYQQDLANNTGISDYTDEYYNIQEADRMSVNEGTDLSDAKDLWENKTVDTGRTESNGTHYEDEIFQGRTQVNGYSSSNVNNYQAEVLASPYADEIDETKIQELINHTNMTAETAIIVLEGEYNRTTSDGYNDQSNGANDYLYGNDINSNYTLNNVDFGLTERPKAQLEISKEVTNVRLTLANGNLLFDANEAADNLIWVDGEKYQLNEAMRNGKYEEYYDESKEDENYHRYSYREEVNKLITGLYGSGQNGLIQATMDEELMHGATIQISYRLTVTNVGETDYTGQDFYYKGAGASEDNKVTTTADIVLDYVANNLQYRETDNENWEVVSAENLTNNDDSKVNDRLVNNSLTEQINQFNTIIQTTGLNTNLKPGEETSKELLLSQLITSQNTQDDKSYDNITEIVQTSNTAGRRMAYSIVGNQDPTTAPTEVDSAMSEKVMILPPFGVMTYIIYAGIAIVAIAILAVGIIFIKKKVTK